MGEKARGSPELLRRLADWLARLAGLDVSVRGCRVSPLPASPLLLPRRLSKPKADSGSSPSAQLLESPAAPPAFTFERRQLPSSSFPGLTSAGAPAERGDAVENAEGSGRKLQVRSAQRS